MNTNKHEVIVCSCEMKEHNLVLSIDDWSDVGQPDLRDYYISVTKYNHKNIFQRIVVAFKYVFGIGENNFYSDIMIDKEGFEKLDAFVKDYKNKKDIK